MINIFKIIEEINNTCKSLLCANKITDYRIILNYNNLIDLYIILGDYEEKDVIIELGHYDDLNICCYSPSEANSDEYLESFIFATNERVNIESTRRRLSNLLNPTRKIKNEAPVVTFYSYKGGVGRSTSLASCASYLAINHKKKIVILDCDFEAPGFTNFYLKDPCSPIYSNGLVEYFMDENIEDKSLNNYCWEVSKFYSGEGEIYVFPAGNLDDEECVGSIFHTNLEHYLNGLTRLDFFSPDKLVSQFELLLKQIKNQIAPDAIFIDSRTGFNDIFGISAFRLSDLVVGFFGNSSQTIPGLHFFMNSLKNESSPRIMMVNSIVPAQGKRSKFESFCEKVDAYLNHMSSDLDNDNDSKEFVLDKYCITYNEVLAALGTPDEDFRDFVDMINERNFPEYNTLFESINNTLEDSINITQETYKLNVCDMPICRELNEQEKNVNSKIPDTEKGRLKKIILSNLKDKMPQLYAENIKDYNEELETGRYFFRTCMEDLFNPDKILVLGNKGTGKSYIYRSLREKKIVSALQKRANKTSLNCKFIHIIDDNKRIDTVKFDSIEGTNDFFFERFWIVYIWNAIMLDSPYGYKSSLEVIPIIDDVATALRFKETISSDEKMIEIESDLNKLNVHLREQNSKIIIIFDELDGIVKPHMWSERISPLINLCRRMKYDSISPKLFLRSDLYEKISNLNNKNELSNRTISIEWNPEELFSYFFKLILSKSWNEFFGLMKLYQFYPNFYINKVVKTIQNSKGQPPLDDYALRHLCGTFFGRYADTNNSPRFGESYDWFFKNLKNANDTISLRPFIDLISEALNHALREDDTDCPILPQYYYTFGKTRAKAVENHFRDLSSEKGNEDLIPIFDYIREKAPTYLKREQLSQKDMFTLLDLIIQEGKLKENEDRDSIISLLLVNGIINTVFIRIGNNVHRNFHFALLYKYYLGLKNKSSNRRKNK